MPPTPEHIKHSSLLTYEFKSTRLAALVVGFYLLGLMPFMAVTVPHIAFGPWPMVAWAGAALVGGHFTCRIKAKEDLKFLKSGLDLAWNLIALVTTGSLFYSALTGGLSDLSKFMESLSAPFFTALFVAFFGVASLRVSVSIAEARNSYIEKREADQKRASLLAFETAPKP